MARNPHFIYARTQFTTAGVKSGKVSNSFTFNFVSTPDPIVSDWDNLIGVIKNFYQVTQTSGHAVRDYLGPQINRGTNMTTTELYQIDVADPHHYLSSPVHVVPWSLAGTAPINPLPNEVAVSLSYRGPYGTDPEHAGSTRPRASDRGRTYIGPLDLSATQTITIPDGTEYLQVHPTFKSTLMQAAQAIFTADGIINWAWSVWSRKEQALKPIVEGAVDQYIDSQRGRGVRDPLQSWVPFT
jgi:hypothetical protein